MLAFLFISALSVLFESHSYKIVNSPPDPPQIGLFRKNFKEVITHTYSPYPKGSNRILLTPPLKIEDYYYEGDSIVLSCISSEYPVMWKYEGQGAPIVRAETLRKVRNFYDKESYSYISLVIFPSSDYRQTGNYTCVSISQPKELYSHFYIFVPSNDHIFIMDNKKTHKLSLANNNGKQMVVTIPCTVADPRAQVTLCKMESGKCELVKAPYDPEKGFTFQVQLYKSTKQTQILYTCLAKLEINDKSETKVIEDKLKFSIEHSGQSQGRAGEILKSRNSLKMDHIEFQYRKDSDMISCCFKNSQNHHQSPQLRIQHCKSIVECEINGNHLYAKEEESSLEKSAPCTFYKIWDTLEQGQIQCSSNGGTITKSQIFSLSNDHMIMDFNEVPEDTNQILLIHKEKAPGSANKMRFICYPNSFYFSTGIKWAVGKASASQLQFLDNDVFPPHSWIELDPKDYPGENLYCFAPIWNSHHDWRNVSTPL